MPIPQRITDHAARFNDAVRTGDWRAFAQTFGGDASLSFDGLPGGATIGPIAGRDAILKAYLSQPPDDTLTVDGVDTDGHTDRVRFTWDTGGSGVMAVTWSGNGLIQGLRVTFDPH